MYQIVVPVDNDETRAIAQAKYITNLPGDPSELNVTVAHAYRDDTAKKNALPDEESPGVIKAVKHLRDAGVTVQTQEIYVPVAEGITDLSTEVDADQIVMGGRKRSPAGKAIFGSVTQSVILDSDIPVTVAAVQ